MERVSKIKVGYAFGSSDHEVPNIRLVGKYLALYGFTVGDEVTVKILPHRIEISKPEAVYESLAFAEADPAKRLMKIGELSGRTESQVLRFLGVQSIAELSEDYCTEAMSKLINKPVGLFTKADILIYCNTNRWEVKK